MRAFQNIFQHPHHRHKHHHRHRHLHDVDSEGGGGACCLGKEGGGEETSRWKYFLTIGAQRPDDGDGDDGGGGDAKYDNSGDNGGLKEAVLDYRKSSPDIIDHHATFLSLFRKTTTLVTLPGHIGREGALHRVVHWIHSERKI